MSEYVICKGKKLNIITRYIRNNHGDMVATLIGLKDDQGSILVGWSKRCKLETKPFIKKYGRDLAVRRAIKPSRDRMIPFVIQPFISEFEERCQKYFFNNQVK